MLGRDPHEGHRAATPLGLLFDLTFDAFHVLLLVVPASFLAVPLLMAAADVELTWCLVVQTLSPWVTVLG